MNYSRYMLIPQDPESKGKLFLCCQCKTVAPLDSYLGLAGLPFKITPAAMLRIAYWAQNQCSYQRAEETISEVMHFHMNDDTIRQVCNYVGHFVFHNDCMKADKAFSMLGSAKLAFPMDREGVLYIQTDGAALNTRLKDADGSTWRENKLGEVFSSADIHYWTDKKGKRQHQILQREFVSYVGPAAEFKKHLLACALRRGYGSFRDTVILSDGATWIRNMVDEIFPDAQQILDFFHLCENVNTFAKHIFNMDATKYVPWAANVCNKLKASQGHEVLRELAPLQNKVPTDCPVNLYSYIANNIRNIDYAAYEQRGFFIGSGSIESGNKTVLQDRLKRSGMRWNISTAQAMLTLKTKAESNLWHSDVEQPFLLHCMITSRLH